MKQWEINRTQFKVSDFLSWKNSGALLLNPSFQRRPVWQPGAKSYLIDTIVRGLPMPIIFLRDQRTDLSNLEPKREVVDGQPRLRTVITYIDPTALEDYNPATDDFTVCSSHNKDLGNKSFSKIKPKFQSRILDYPFSVHVLPPGTEDRDVLQLFARMNSTGVKTNPQELRNAEYFGEFKTSMYTLAAEQLFRWRNWKAFTEYNIARMEEVELTSEIAHLMLKGISGKNQPSLNNIYDDHDSHFPKRSEIERGFRIIMDIIDEKLGVDMNNLRLSKKTLIYSLIAFIYDTQFGIDSPLKRVKPESLTTRTIEWIRIASENIISEKAPKEILDAAARRTTNRKERDLVINYLKSGE